jgi:nucleotide-binding universal stress UspA family protein
MLKILAPTDFSDNSKAGLRFALQWASMQKIQIIFIHFFHSSRYPEWTDAEFKLKVEEETIYYRLKLEQFVRAICKSTRITPGKYSCIARYGFSADVAIMDFCRSHGSIDYICIATRGAGNLNKMLGTHTGNLTTRSQVPVITVPKNYRRRPITDILYATDFRNYAGELLKVLAFAKPLGAKITLLHFCKPNEALPDEKAFRGIKKRLRYDIDFLVKTSGPAKSLLQDLQNGISAINPSLIIMFTNQHRNFFQKILFPSNTEMLSFRTTIPLLSFNK